MVLPECITNLSVSIKARVSCILSGEQLISDFRSPRVMSEIVTFVRTGRT